VSYARFAEDSDVYCYGANSGGFCCCGCAIAHLLPPTKDAGVGGWWCLTVDEAIAHLKGHQECGHEVPDRAFDQLDGGRDSDLDGTIGGVFYGCAYDEMIGAAS